MELMIKDSCHVTYKTLSFNNDFSHIEETNYFQLETNTDILYSNSIELVIYLEKFKYSFSKEDNMLLHLPDVNDKKSISIYKDIIKKYFHFFLEINPIKISISHEHNINAGLCYLNVCVTVKELFTKVLEPFQFVVKDLEHPFLMNSLFLVLRMKEKYNEAICDFINERRKENGLSYFIFDEENDMINNNAYTSEVNGDEKEDVENNNKEFNEDENKEGVENDNSNYVDINVSNNNKTPVKIKQRLIDSYFISQNKEKDNESSKPNHNEPNENCCNFENEIHNNEINKDLNIENQISITEMLNLNENIINNKSKRDLLELSQPDVIINDSFSQSISKIQNQSFKTTQNTLVASSKEEILTQYPLISKWNSYYIIPKGLRKKKILFIYTSQSSLNLSDIIYQLIPEKETLQIKQNFHKKPKRINSTYIKYIYFCNITHFPYQVNTFIKNTIINNINSTNNTSFFKNKNIKELKTFKEFFYNLHYPCILTTTNINLIKLCYSSPLVKSLSFFQEIPNIPHSLSDTNSFNDIENDFNPSLINEMNKTQLLQNKYIIN